MRISDWSSDVCSSDLLESEPLADGRVIPFRTGRRKLSWSHNVVALGLSSGFLEPLESTSIHFIQNGIQRLLALFPDKPISPLERDEYNSGMRDLYEDVRDFIIIHYKATQRDDQHFWSHVAEMDMPDSHARRRSEEERLGQEGGIQGRT